MIRITNTALVFTVFLSALLPAAGALACGAPVRKATNSGGLSSALSSVVKAESTLQSMATNEPQIIGEKYQQELIQLRDAVIKKRQTIAAGKKN